MSNRVKFNVRDTEQYPNHQVTAWLIAQFPVTGMEAGLLSKAATEPHAYNARLQYLQRWRQCV